MVYGKDVENREDIKDNELYIVGDGYGTEEEARDYAKVIKASPRKIIKGPRGYAVIQKGKDISMFTWIAGSVRYYR